MDRKTQAITARRRFISVLEREGGMQVRMEECYLEQATFTLRRFVVVSFLSPFPVRHSIVHIQLLARHPM